MKLRLSSPLTTALTIALCALAWTAPVRAQSPSEDGGTMTPEQAAQAKALLEQSGMSADEMQAKLRDAGLTGPGANPLAAPARGPRRDAMPPVEPPIKPDSLALMHPPTSDDSLEPFGFEIFHYAPTTFEPLSYGPVDADYRLGPGDEVVLTLWGDDQLSLSLTISREGVITLPDVGQLTVNGLTLEEARARVRAALARVYSGLRGEGHRSTTSISLSLGRLRSIQVFLLGHVVRPGSYTISSVSRLLNALYAAGGPMRDGSLRDVRIVRGGQPVASVDLYDVILGGAAQQVPRLQNGDVVFVPAAQRRVRVRGPVRREGLYELRAGEQLRALLTIAGGPLPEADLAHAQIERVTPAAMRDSLRGQGRVALDVSLSSVLGDSLHDVAMTDGDTLRVQAVPDRRGNVVLITGRGVQRPGTYEFHAGMHVSDLIAAAGGFSSDAYLEHALITRTMPDSSRSALRFAPARAMQHEPSDDLALQTLDDLAISSLWDLRERQSVTVHGLVRNPGTYELLDGMTLTDLLMRAGGLTDDALAVRAELARVSSGARIADTLEIPLSRDLAQAGPAAATRLLPHDAVFIRRDPSYTEQQYVAIDGEVRFPGTYALTRRDERVDDLVRRSGGLTEFSYPRGAQFHRAGGGVLAINLPQALHDARNADNLVLQPGDTLIVPRYTPTVKIEGAVLSPVTALFTPGAGVGWYVTQASGFRQDADRRGIVVVSPSGRVTRGGAPEPGSRILVPARVLGESRDHLKDFATLMSVIASAATTAYLIHQSSK